MHISSFVTNVIHLYINDELNDNISPNSHIIKVLLEDNENGYYVTVIGYKKRLLTSSDSAFFGCCKFEDYDVFFYGLQHTEFVTGKLDTKCKKMFIDKIGENSNVKYDPIEYDPVEFKISLFKNFEFDKMHSFKGNIYANIDDLKAITEKYLKIKNSFEIDATKKDVYSNVQHPASFEGGVDSLLSLVYHNPLFKRLAETDNTSQKVLVQFIVTKDGNVKEPRIITSSGSEKTDEIILEIIQKFPKMLPAEHRNELVDSYLTIQILIPNPK